MIADFRDPWTQIDFYHELMLSKWADRRHINMERAVLSAADRTVVVGSVMGEEFKNLGADNLVVITNGYDSEDMKKKELK